MGKQYIAIIGDIYNSRLIEDRKAAQEALLDCLRWTNQYYKDFIISEFTISMGDSFQGLLTMEAPFNQMLLAIEQHMSPLDFRFGIGIGEITTAINAENSQLNDGPAYHHARKALEMIEENEHKYSTRKTSILLLSATEETPTDRLINAVFTLNTAVKSGWTERQKEIIRAYIENNENQYQTAAALNIGQSNISKTLKATDFYSFQAALNDIEVFINTQKKGDIYDD